ncbi:MAG: hypothetical protein KC457_31100 [Myxococcales bacterium]|nr:hypothetical protein [Myxococcales bacterium]
MQRLAAILVLPLLFACSSQNSNTPAEAPPEEKVADPNAEPPGEPPENCDFEVDGTCYMDQDAACKAAGCEPDKCMVMESYPAQIKCG